MSNLALVYKNCSPPKTCTNKLIFFTARTCRDGHTLRFSRSAPSWGDTEEIDAVNFGKGKSVKVRGGRREGDGTENVMTERPSYAHWFCPQGPVPP